MRHITKTIEPDSIKQWKDSQLPVGLNLDYANFTRKPQLRGELIAEQYGLCAYTGVAIDARLVGLHETDLAFQAHIEHVKPRSVCEKELVARGGTYGRDLCEDMDFRNLVAALDVIPSRRSRSEFFGAAAHKDDLLPVTPLQANCQSRFRYDAYGKVQGLDVDATQTIELLNLNHRTLQGWRRSAIGGFFPTDIEFTREEIEAIMAAMDRSADGELPEFCFCIWDVAQSLLNSEGSS